MVPRERLINKLRELGYTYRDQTLRSQLWRKRGGTHYVWIPKKEDPVSETYVRNLLRQCGMQPADVDTFIGACRAH